MSLWRIEANNTLDRALRVLGTQKTPLRWAGVVPQLPTGQLVSREQCVALHQQTLKPDIVPRTVPGGTIAVLTSEERDTWVQTGITALTFTGLVFACEYTVETRKTHFVEFTYTSELFEKVFAAAAELYHEISLADLPLCMCVGVRNAFGCRIQSTGERVGRPFPDDEFILGIPISAKQFLTDYSAERDQLYDEFTWSFDIAPELP